MPAEVSAPFEGSPACHAGGWASVGFDLGEILRHAANQRRKFVFEATKFESTESLGSVEG